MKTFEPWIKGLIAAFIGGAATSVTNVMVAPDTFNFHYGFTKLWQSALASGVFSICFYLKQSPVPKSDSQPETPKQ